MKRLEKLYEDISLVVQSIPDDSKTTQLLEVLGTFRDQYSALQAELDRKVAIEIMPWIRTQIDSAGSCDWAIRTFSKDWFANQLFSSTQLSGIAQALLDATAPYIAPIKLWQDIASGNFSAVDNYSDEEENANDNEMDDLG